MLKVLSKEVIKEDEIDTIQPNTPLTSNIKYTDPILKKAANKSEKILSSKEKYGNMKNFVLKPSLTIRNPRVNTLETIKKEKIN